MLLEIISLFALFISLYGWGLWARHFFLKEKISVALTCILGIITLSTLATLCAFFYPLNVRSEIIFLLLSVIPFFFKIKKKNVSLYFPEYFKSGWFYFFLLLILFTGCYHPFLPDHYQYYTPTINWLNQEGIIIGLANIDWMLGQVSTWHILQAAVDNTIDPFQRINIFISIIYLIYIFERKAFALMLFLPIAFLYNQTPSPDLPTILFSLIVVNEVCFNKKGYHLGLMLSISSFLFVVKPTAFWLLMWLFFVAIFKKRKEILSYKTYILPALLIGLFFIKNSIVSSSLIYPITITQINTPWITDAQILIDSDCYATLFPFYGHFTLEEVTDFSWFEKFYHWITIKPFNLFVVVVIIVFGLFLLKKKNLVYSILWIVVFLKFLLIFNFSGQFRFLLDGTFALLFILINQFNFRKVKILFCAFFISVLFIIPISFPWIIQKINSRSNIINIMSGFTKEVFFKPQTHVFGEYKKDKLGNLEFYISTKYMYDYDTPPPAFLKSKLQYFHFLTIFPQMIDSSDVRKGFYIKKLSEEEAGQLQEIIDRSYESNTIK